MAAIRFTIYDLGFTIYEPLEDSVPCGGAVVNLKSGGWNPKPEALTMTFALNTQDACSAGFKYTPYFFRQAR
jgi:hypothetical protein